MKRLFAFRLGTLFVGVVLLSGCSAYTVGNMKLNRKDYDAAIAHYREDLSQNPDHWQARERLGFAYLKTGQLDEAIAELSKVLEQEPGDSYATFYLGLAWLSKGERGKAIETWKTYRNGAQPLVEQEIKRQVTLLEISESLHLAKESLADEEKLQATPPKPGTVAVFYFKDLSADRSLRQLQKALAMMIITDLSQIRSLQVVERLRVQFLLAEMGLGQTGLVDEGTAPRAGRLLGAENLIVGTMEPGSLEVKASVASTSKRDVLGAFSLTAEEQEFFELQKEIVFNIVKVLGISLTPEEKELLGTYHTKNFQAVVYFGQALDALDAGQWEEARDFFQKALEEDPDFLLARWGAEACPDASAPSIGELEAMSVGEFSTLTESALTRAEKEQQAEHASVADEGGEGEAQAQGEEGETTGSVSVGW